MTLAGSTSKSSRRRPESITDPARFIAEKRIASVGAVPDSDTVRPSALTAAQVYPSASSLVVTAAAERVSTIWAKPQDSSSAQAEVTRNAASVRMPGRDRRSGRMGRGVSANVGSLRSTG